MKIRLLSDIHLETGPFTYEDQGEDVVVLAGDIGEGTAGIEWAKQSISKPVIYVAGNHEFYKRDLFETLKELRAAAEGSNVHFLDNDEIFLTAGNETVRFVGCTLWTDFGKEWVAENPLPRSTRPDIDPVTGLMVQASMSMNDYRYITAKSWFEDPQNIERLQALKLFLESMESKRLNPMIVADLNDAALEFLATSLILEACPRTVVVTHHAPSYQSLLVGRFINEGALRIRNWIPSSSDHDRLYKVAGYASHCEHFMEWYEFGGVETPWLWLHGHTHARLNYVIGQTLVACNPRGYHRGKVHKDDVLMFRLAFGEDFAEQMINHENNLTKQDPERGNGDDFERNLVIDSRTAAAEQLKSDALSKLSKLDVLLSQFTSLTRLLKRRDLEVVALAGEKLEKVARAFNDELANIVQPLREAVIGHSRNRYQDVGHYWVESAFHLLNLDPDKDLYLYPYFTLNSPFDEDDEAVSNQRLRAREWGRERVNNMKRARRMLEKRIDIALKPLTFKTRRYKVFTRRHLKPKHKATK